MPQSSHKFRIFLMRVVDWFFLLAVTATGIYAVLYAENRELMALAALAGLFMVDRFGDFVRETTARLTVDMESERKRFARK